MLRAPYPDRQGYGERNERCEPGSRRCQLPSDGGIHQRGEDGGQREHARKFRERRETERQAESPPCASLPLRQRDGRACRRHVEGNHRDVRRRVERAHQEQGHRAHPQVRVRRLAIAAAKSARKRRQAEAQTEARDDRRHAYCERRFTEQQAKRDHGPDHQRRLVEVAPVRVTRTVPVVRFVPRERHDRCKQHAQGGGDREYEPEGPSGARIARRFLHPGVQTDRLRFQSSRRVCAIVAGRTVVAPCVRGRWRTPTWVRFMPAFLARRCSSASIRKPSLESSTRSK